MIDVSSLESASFVGGITRFVAGGGGLAILLNKDGSIFHFHPRKWVNASMHGISRRKWKPSHFRKSKGNSIQNTWHLEELGHKLFKNSCFFLFISRELNLIFLNAFSCRSNQHFCPRTLLIFWQVRLILSFDQSENHVFLHCMVWGWRKAMWMNLTGDDTLFLTADFTMFLWKRFD